MISNNYICILYISNLPCRCEATDRIFRLIYNLLAYIIFKPEACYAQTCGVEIAILRRGASHKVLFCGVEVAKPFQRMSHLSVGNVTTTNRRSSCIAIAVF